MNSRERIVTALNHEAPDRLPIDLGGSVVSSIALSTYAALRDHLKLPKVPIRTLETVQQIAVVDDDVLDRFGVDVIPVFANPPAGYTPRFVDEAGGSDSFKDEFGATLRRFKGCLYYDWQEFPLGEPSIEAMQRMPWPDPADPARYRGLRERVQQLRAATDRALFGMAPCGHDLFNQLLRVRGMAEGLMDLVAEPEFAEAFLERLTGTIITAQQCFLDEVGDLIDVHFTADDLTGQNSPLISPALYRRMIKPRWARIIQAIKARTKAKIFYHGCGAIEPVPAGSDRDRRGYRQSGASVGGRHGHGAIEEEVREASFILGRRLRHSECALMYPGRLRKGGKPGDFVDNVAADRGRLVGHRG